ncbi:MAG: PD40 domain-containing protein [Actinobacteria bacterium]|nr:PD40 domain-containing protein [Actinomycetota bacterium]
MKRKLILFSIALALVLLFAVTSIMASRSQWTLLGSEDYKLIARVGDLPVVFNALQDKDKRRIVEARAKNPGIEKRWKNSRPDVVPPLKIKTILPQNSLADVKTSSFDVAFEDEEGQRVGKVNKFIAGGKALLAIEPEFSCFELTPSSDYSKYIIPTGKGLWLVDPEKERTTKITADSYGGKTIDELRGYGIATGKEESWSLFWNDNPLFSPDGSKIVYVTNRDCLEKGTSIWLLDLSTGDEHPLKNNENGEHYRVRGWIDNDHILYSKFTGNLDYAFIADISGNYSEMDMPSLSGVLAQHPNGMIAHTPDYEAGKDIFVAKIGADKSLIKLHKIDCSHLTYDSVGFSPDGSKVVFAYMVDDRGTENISVVDLNSKKELVLTDPPSRGHVLGDVKWLDNERLLIHTEEVINGVGEVSTWIYSLKGDDTK